MGAMNNFGERMAKKPMVPILVILIVTAASLGIIAMDPPSFDMDEDSFMPENDITEAASVISTAFSTSSTVMSTIDAGGVGGDIFTTEVFLSVLYYEQSLYSMQYTDVNGVADNPYYYLTGDVNVNGFTVVSPVSSISAYIAATTGYGTNMIGAISALTDAELKTKVSEFFSVSQYAAMTSLLTTDYDPTSVTAKGCMITIIMLNTAVDNIADGVIGFEKDVGTAVVSFMETGDYMTGLSIGVVDLNTMMDEIGSMANEDMGKLIPIALILIVVILLLMYRDFLDMIIGILGLGIAIIWTFGIATAVGINMTVISIAVPILILGMGIDYGLHLVIRYREERREGFDSEKASGRTVNSVGEALVLATVTTVIAFLSYLTSSMAALADFGLMCAIGITCAFLVMLLMIPALQSVRDRRTEKKGKEVTELRRYRKSESEHGDILGKVAGIGGRMAAKKPWAVLGVACVVVVGFGAAATTIGYEFDMYEFIPDGTDASDTLNYMNDNYSLTTNTTSVVIYADPWDIDTMRAIETSVERLNAKEVSGLAYVTGNGLEDPEYINLVLKNAYDASTSAADFNDAYEDVFDTAGYILSSATQAEVDVLKGAFYNTDNIGILATHLQSMSSVVGDNGGSPVTQIILHITEEAADGGDATLRMMDSVNDTIGDAFSSTGIKAVTTGSAIAMAVNLDEMNSSQMSSLILTLILVLIILTLVMYYTDRSWWLGLMSTIPTLVAVVMVWGTMALLGISLNVLTLTIASLTVGMGVTYGIHIAHRFVTDLREGNCSANDAIKAATRETGKGVFGAALTTAAGFGVIGFSAMIPMQQFGMITAMAIAFGYIGATFLLPSLLVIWGRHVEKKMCKPEEPSEPAEA